MSSMKDEFIRIVRAYIKRDGIENLLQFVEGTDFYTSPASTRYHGSFEGGLVLHSLNVFAELKKLCTWYDCDVSMESIALVALFHDLCKADTYTIEMRWRKNDNNQWEQYPTYKRDEKFAYGGHGSKSVYLVQSFMRLEPFEASAINCHMGQWDATTYSNPTEVYECNKLAWLLHVADEAATYLDDKEEL